MLLDAVNVALTAATAVQIYDAVRIKRIRGWTTSNLQAGGANFAAPCLSLSLPGGSIGAVGSQLEVNCTTNSTTEPAYCTISPDPLSGNALFNSNGAVAAYRVDLQNGPQRVIVEADLEYRFSSDNAPTATANAPAGATPGQFYFRGMDGLAIAATLWPPSLFPFD